MSGIAAATGITVLDDYVRKNIPTAPGEGGQVRLSEVVGRDEVVVVHPAEKSKTSDVQRSSAGFWGRLRDV